jgi:hypothetical protein
MTEGLGGLATPNSPIGPRRASDVLKGALVECLLQALACSVIGWLFSILYLALSDEIVKLNLVAIFAIGGAINGAIIGAVSSFRNADRLPAGLRIASGVGSFSLAAGLCIPLEVGPKSLAW